MGKDDNALKETIELVQSLWLHRPGNEVHAAVQETINALYRDLKPLIIKKIKTDNQWTFLIRLPPGRAFSEFKGKHEYFQDAAGGAVQIEKEGKVIKMQISTEELRPNYPYSWQHEDYSKMFLPVPFGHSAAGLIVRDLAEAPNLIVAGHPGAGKSNFLHVLAVSLLLSRMVYLAIIDLKKLEFSYLKGHSLVVTDLEKGRALLMSINKEIDKRLGILEAAGVVKIQEYEENMPFIVLIIDELAEMQDEDCQEALNRIVRLGRAAGVCVVPATQRPSSTMYKKFGDSKAMFAATMCFHVRDELNSRIVLDNGKGALIPNIPGRAVYQWEREIEVQSMYLPIKKARKLINNVRQVEWNVDQSQKRLPPR
ncbi:FtsK/SpoIIIE domain-containing protein [Desulfitibacter alkalitolerans]|uniref:FtsK/SpoIIIE domain-containing protein n=1 Tax=Desulfitibacter alkalitolerans TaxID=264641 RepID=UPI00048535EA|nr:FtsK/SpoIIIE domain-containing protein [Desulfitibacter alkalitolerans]